MSDVVNPESMSAGGPGLLSPTHAHPVTATSLAGDVETAATELCAGLGGCDPGLVLVFAAARHALDGLGAALRQRLPEGCVLMGCSTAGELWRDGYHNDSAVAIGFPKTGFRTAALKLRGLSRLCVSDWITQLRALHDRFRPAPNKHLIALLLVDGLCTREEMLSVAIDAALPDVPVFGGSTGFGRDHRHGDVLLDGDTDTDSAVFCLIESDLVIHPIVIDHFRSLIGDMVVTAARPEPRILDEINAEPAAEEYARLVGVDRARLSTAVFAQHPLIVQINGRNYVRAIRAQTSDGGLVLMSAVETGTVLQLGLAEDLAGGFERALGALPERPVLTLSFDCILRRIAVERAGISQSLQRSFDRYNIAGFNTYGEQHGGMHVNQTFIGLAFLPQKASDAYLR